MAFEEPGASAIVVLTPEAEPLIGEIYRVHSQAGADGMTPHITLLVPFVPAAELDVAVDSRLRAVFASFGPFEYALTRLDRFEGSVLYLAPEPSSPFVELTNALWRAFPEYPPYGGIHDDVVPHATVAESDDETLLARITADLEPQLPLLCRAEVATIVERGADLRWRPRVAFPLGG
jgi:2'-5' RNA ligase superfamily protein